MEENGTARQGADDNMVWRMRLACSLNKATDTQQECNTSCFCTVSVVTGTRLFVTCIRTYIACLVNTFPQITL